MSVKTGKNQCGFKFFGLSQREVKVFSACQLIIEAM
jgi:hypothetical protein